MELFRNSGTPCIQFCLINVLNQNFKQIVIVELRQKTTDQVSF
jgi:hypothetical protein